MHIRQTHFANPSLTKIAIPVCPRCHCRMALIGISLGPLQRERRMFECTPCGQTQEVAIWRAN
jgi:hypothetical protein